jgi:hypothetical protein
MWHTRSLPSAEDLVQSALARAIDPNGRESTRVAESALPRNPETGHAAATADTAPSPTKPSRNASTAGFCGMREFSTRSTDG